ncbi:uncharacterized protein LOC110178629 isoform X2 [Drosophila serrata]|uniref:uncharacterized protein LOC110178629 isoform X2 n=1 Tax=Drosophila serrata TaxID=7274 RepID=UPI000A1D24FF|nr:uncharacterized protein LOC110178629 isoform X2 [Drosophila serrata]
MGSEIKLEDKLEKYWRRLFYLRPLAEPTGLDLSELEYFGVFSVRDPLAPDRRLWHIYSCTQPEIPELGNKIRQKYGKKNVWEIYRKSTYSAVGFRSIVRKHFSHLKWITNGNLLEAPAKSHYNDERVVRDVSDLYEREQRRLFDYIMVQHDWFKRYNDQKPPPRRH